MDAVMIATELAVWRVDAPKESLPEPVHKPPGRPPGMPIIKNPPRSPEVREIDGSRPLIGQYLAHPMIAPSTASTDSRRRRPGSACLTASPKH